MSARRAFLAVLASAVVLASCAGAPEPKPAPALTAAAPQRIWPHEIRGELVTASTVGAGQLLIGTNRGRVYAVPREQLDTPPRLILGPPPGTEDSGTGPGADIPNSVSTIELSPDGRVLAVVSDGVVFGPIDGGPFTTRTAEFGTNTLAFDPGGGKLAAAGSGVMVFDVRTGDVIGRHELAEVDYTFGKEDVAFTPDGGVVAVGEATDRWPAGSRTTVTPRIDCGCLVSGAAAAPDGSHLVYGTTDSHLVVVETQSGRVVLDKTISAEHRDLARAVAVSSDGSRAIALTNNGNGMIVDIGSRQVLWRGTLPGHAPLSVRFVDEDTAFLFDAAGDPSGQSASSISTWIVPLAGP